MTRRRGPGERGTASVEFALIVPALLMLLALVIATGRLAHAHLTVQQIADSAARTASIARDATTARGDAGWVAQSDAAASGLRCGGGLGVELDVSGFAVPVGQPARVRATVRCGVDLSDLVVPGLPGTLLVEKGASSSLDRYRGRR